MNPYAFVNSPLEAYFIYLHHISLSLSRCVCVSTRVTICDTTSQPDMNYEPHINDTNLVGLTINRFEFWVYSCNDYVEFGFECC